MKLLQRNKSVVWYKLYQGNAPIYDANGDDTGETTNSYSAMQSIKMYVSASKGQADQEMFGVNTNYTKTLITDDMSCPIDEHSILWIGTNQGEHNYVVVQVAKSFNHITYAIREVTVG